MTEVGSPGGDISQLKSKQMSTVEQSEIRKTFTGATVFLTGGTGFLGKLLVEKLLRCCPDIKTIYLLARPKKNKEPLKRLQEQFEDPLYDLLKKEKPDFIKKISIVEGDVGKIGLGISQDDRRKIVDEVDIIFHGAATVRFDEPIKMAVEINVRGTREMMLLAKSCNRLRALVHISTAFSNCPVSEIKEQFYQSCLPGDKLIDLVETTDEAILNSITKGLMGPFPNSYAFTKAAAEDVVLKYSKGLPVAMFRPSIVIGTAKEPLSGWIDNLYGPTGVVVGASVGILHVLHCDPNVVADLVPGDMVVNACIAIAWQTARQTMTEPANDEEAPPVEAPKVYNYVSSEDSPLTWRDFMGFTESHFRNVPPIQAVWYYLLFLTPSKTMFTILSLLLHWLPAYIVDGVLTTIGKKPMLRKAYTKIEKFSDVISYFAIRQWKFTNDNSKNLYKELNEFDKELFDFNLSGLNWKEFFHGYVRGVRVYLMKDSLKTVPRGLRKYYTLKVAHYIFVSLLAYVFIKFCWFIVIFVFGF